MHCISLQAKESDEMYKFKREGHELLQELMGMDWQGEGILQRQQCRSACMSWKSVFSAVTPLSMRRASGQCS